MPPSCDSPTEKPAGRTARLVCTLVAGAAFFCAAPALALDILDLMGMERRERVDTVAAFLASDAPDTDPAVLIALFNPDLELDPDQLKAVYRMVRKQMPRQSYPELSAAARSRIPAIAVPALRLLGRSANPDAFDVLNERLQDSNEAVSNAAIDGLAALGDPAALPLLEPRARTFPDADRMPPDEYCSRLKAPMSAALALAHLGDWSVFDAFLEGLGDINRTRYELIWNACRTTYNTAEQCEAALKAALRIKDWLHIVIPSLHELAAAQPAAFARTLAASAHPYAVDAGYGVVAEVLRPDNAAEMLPLMSSPSAELKNLYVDLAFEWLGSDAAEAVRNTIREQAGNERDVRARLFGLAQSGRLPAEEREAILLVRLSDSSAWVRYEAAVAARGMESARLGARLADVAENDPDAAVREAAAGRTPPFETF